MGRLLARFGIGQTSLEQARELAGTREVTEELVDDRGLAIAWSPPQRPSEDLDYAAKAPSSTDLDETVFSIGLV